MLGNTTIAKVYASLPSTATVASATDVEQHWLTNQPVKLYNGNWIRREQEGIFRLMGVRELIIVWALPNNLPQATIILVG